MCFRIPVILYCGFKFFSEHHFIKISYGLATLEECVDVVLLVDSLAMADRKSIILYNTHL